MAGLWTINDENLVNEKEDSIEVATCLNCGSSLTDEDFRCPNCTSVNIRTRHFRRKVKRMFKRSRGVPPVFRKGIKNEIQ